MGEHEEGERGEVRGCVTGPRFGEVADHDQRDLVGRHETDRPERQPQQATDRGVAELEHRPEPEPGVEHGGDEHDRHRGDAECGPEAEGVLEAVVAEHVVEHPFGRPGIRQRQERGDDDHVGQDRAPRRGEEPAPAVEERVRQPDEAVEQDLDQEDPRQRGADGAEHVGVDVGSDVNRVHPEDQRRGDDGDHGECQHQQDRHAQDDVGGPLVVVLVEGGEQWHERGRQDATEQQLVHDVRRLVRQAVGVGQCGLTEDVGEGDDAEQARDARQRGPGGDREIAAQQSAHRRSVSSVTLAIRWNERESTFGRGWVRASG